MLLVYNKLSQLQQHTTFNVRSNDLHLFSLLKLTKPDTYGHLYAFLLNAIIKGISTQFNKNRVDMNKLVCFSLKKYFTIYLL